MQGRRYRDLEAYWMRGLAYRELRQYKKALADLAKAKDDAYLNWDKNAYDMVEKVRKKLR